MHDLQRRTDPAGLSGRSGKHAIARCRTQCALVPWQRAPPWHDPALVAGCLIYEPYLVIPDMGNASRHRTPFLR